MLQKKITGCRLSPYLSEQEGLHMPTTILAGSVRHLACQLMDLRPTLFLRSRCLDHCVWRLTTGIMSGATCPRESALLRVIAPLSKHLLFSSSSCHAVHLDKNQGRNGRSSKGTRTRRHGLSKTGIDKDASLNNLQGRT